MHSFKEKASLTKLVKEHEGIVLFKIPGNVRAAPSRNNLIYFIASEGSLKKSAHSHHAKGRTHVQVRMHALAHAHTHAHMHTHMHTHTHA